MYVFLPDAFYSVRPASTGDADIEVRARVKADMDLLSKWLEKMGDKCVPGREGPDYRYRLITTTGAWGAFLAEQTLTEEQMKRGNETLRDSVHNAVWATSVALEQLDREEV